MFNSQNFKITGLLHIKYNGRFYASFMFHCEPILRVPGYIIFLLQLLKLQPIKAL